MPENQLPCTHQPEEICADCPNRETDLVCRNDPALTRAFNSLHIPMRVVIFGVLAFISWMSGN